MTIKCFTSPSRLLAGRVHARRESIEEVEEDEEMVEEEMEKDSGMGSEDSQAGSNERLLPPMEPSARYYNTFSKIFKSNLSHFHWFLLIRRELEEGTDLEQLASRRNTCEFCGKVSSKTL